ncbi:hypothetical protein [Lacticaseibacillus daqingensis]|uniref:hypothetical protein n=1 Tax=Lacticaseibacillus daqingensis TaxID=2486014 RepID=UPI000F774592|nr:hypothetical protein [Lacticaseibacillus daqingensis]
MWWRYYRQQVRLLLRQPKTWLAGGLMLLATLSFGVRFNAASLPPERLRPSALATEIKTLQSATTLDGLATAALRQDQAIQRGLRGSVAARRQAMTVYLQRLDLNFYDANNYSYPAVYYTDRSLNADPVRDGHFGVSRMLAQLAGIARVAPTLPQAWLDEQTFSQTLVRVSAVWLPWACLLAIMLIGGDVVVRDWRHETVTWALPLSVHGQLAVKAAAVLTLVAAGVLAFVGLLALWVMPQNGLGHGAIIAHYTGHKFAFDLLTPAQYDGWLAVLLGLMSWLVIRLLMLLQVLVRRTGLAVGLAAVLGLTALVTLVRDGGTVRTWPLWLPTTYLPVGRVITGAQGFWYSAARLTAAQAALVFGLWIGGVELGLWLAVRHAQHQGVMA